MSSYSVVDVAAMLKVNEETVRRWIREGKLVANLKRGRGGSSIELEDVVNFVNRTPGSHAYLALDKWLNENNIRHIRCTDNNGDALDKTVKGATAVASSAVLGASLAGPVGGIFGGMLGTAVGAILNPEPREQILLLDTEDEEVLILDSENNVVEQLPEKTDNISDNTVSKPECTNDSCDDDINKKIIAEQMKLLRLKQELAQINAKISICEAEIEYYKLLQNGKY